MQKQKTRGETRKADETRISVLVADNTRLGTELLVATLRSCAELCTIAGDKKLEEFAVMLKSNQPDVVIIGADTRTDGVHAFEMVRLVRSTFPAVAAVVLLESDNNALAVESYRAGARGVCCHENSTDELIQCLKSVHEGKVWMSAVHLRHVVDAFAESDPPMRSMQPVGMPSLSKREMEILRAVADGRSNKEIATRLQLSSCTIKNYLRRVFDKVGVSNRTELAVYVLHHRSMRAERSEVSDLTETASSGKYLPV